MQPRAEAPVPNVASRELDPGARNPLSAFCALLEKRRFLGVPDAQTPEGILDDSLAHQEDITDQLGLQVREAVILLIRALDRADRERARALLAVGITPEMLYEACLTVMMRLVFVLSAEERRLLPLDNDVYVENYAVAPLRAALELEEQVHGAGVLERRFSAWAGLFPCSGQSSGAYITNGPSSRHSGAVCLTQIVSPFSREEPKVLAGTISGQKCFRWMIGRCSTCCALCRY